MIHQEEFDLAGRNVKLKNGEVFRVEDWADRVLGGSWMYQKGNPCAIKYAIRAGCEGLPVDNEVLYGKKGAFGEMVHVSEIDGY